MKNDLAQIENTLKVTDLLCGVSCAVVGVNAEKKVSVITADAERLLSLMGANILGHPISDLPEPLPAIFGEIFQGAQRVSREIPRPTAGASATLHAEAAPFFNEGKIAGAMLTLNDFSELKKNQEKLEAQLERINRLASIGTLSASMAHEIKNALVAVRTFTDLLLAQNQNDELAGIVGREMTRINSIVSQMLRFSGPAKPRLVPLHLHDTLDQSIRLVQNHLEQKKIKVIRSFDAASDVIQGDDYQLKQAFLNLLLNALEATPPGGKLNIETSVADDTEIVGILRESFPTQLRVTIRDNGTGVSAEDFPRLFEPFFTTKPKGTGLGLPITRRIIHEHRGKISVESELGKGAAFQITVPLHRQ
ncbi:MAG: ATP-binding protein [Verrucomicrobiota bacterium]